MWQEKKWPTGPRLQCNPAGAHDSDGVQRAFRQLMHALTDDELIEHDSIPLQFGWAMLSIPFRPPQAPRDRARDLPLHADCALAYTLIFLAPFGKTPERTYWE